MENMIQKAYQMDEMKRSVDVIKVSAEKWMVVPDNLAVPGHSLHIGHSLQRGQLLHLIGGDDFKQENQRNPGFFALEGLADYARKFIPVKTAEGFTDKDYVDLEIGVRAKEVICEYGWMNECPRYVGYENDLIGRIAKKLKDKGYALGYISVERVKELKDEDYELLCIPFEPVKGLKDDGHALKLIPVEAVKVSKDDACALKSIPVETVKEFKAHGYAMFIPVETVKELKDEYIIKMESGVMIEAVMNKSWLKNKCIECFGYANDYIEKMAKREMGLLFSGATMQNIYQLVTSGMVTTGKGKTLMKLNETAFMFLLYGLVMPRRAAGHIALAIGVALASAAYLVTLSFAF